MQTKYPHIDIFSGSNPNQALNVTYNISNMGYCPYWIYVGGACYWLNVAGTKVNDTISTAGIESVKLSDPTNIVTSIMAVKDSGNIRIKLTLNSAISYIGIMPLRINTDLRLVSYRESLS